MPYISPRPNRQQRRLKPCGEKTCKEVFLKGEGKGVEGRYCSQECSDLNHGLQCGYEPCSKRYPAGSGDGMFCSRECAEKFVYSSALPFFREQYATKARAA